MIGERIREFEILALLGKGGYGEVYLARDTNVDREVAIKVILPKFTNDPEFKQRFDTEARVVANLECHQIVPLYTYWQDERGAFLVMRYIKGGNLQRVILKKEALSLSETIRITYDIARGLAVAHKNNVVHRDIKPANILFDDDGNAYLTDFGIAKRADDANSITGSDVIVGTLAYLSPEQINQDEVLPQSDVYSLGIMVYEMLTGRVPFESDSPGGLLMKHLQNPMPLLTLERPDLPEALNEVIATATAKRPQDRYDSALDFVADLKAVATKSTQELAAIPEHRRKKPTTQSGRNRHAMLDNLRVFWIEGVLENSLHDAAMIELGLKPEKGKVKNPWDTVIRTPQGEEAPTKDDILEVFDGMHGKLLILGNPGSGKTTTLLALARELLLRAEADNLYPTPVVLNLSSWSEKRLPLAEWLVEELTSKYRVHRKIGEQWVENEELLLLLDGLDEVAPDVREDCVRAINDFRILHNFVDMVVCCRTDDYDALSGTLSLNGAIVIQPLDDVQITRYLEALGDDVAAVRALITMDAQLRELAKSPLMLSIIILAFRNKATSEIPTFENIEAQREYLFDVYFQRMFERRGGEILYSPQETRHYLSWLARRMKEHARSVFQIEELQPNVLPPEERGDLYGRVQGIHILVTILIWSLQAWLLALPSNISGATFAIGSGVIGGGWLGWAFSTNEWKRWYVHIIFGIIQGVSLYIAAPGDPLPWAIIWGLGAAAYGQVGVQLYLTTGGDKDTIPLIETVKFRWGSISPREWILLVITPLLTIGGVMWASGFETEPSRVVLSWLAASFLGSAFIAYFSGLDFGIVSMRTEPNQGVYSTFWTASTVAVITMVGTIFGSFILATLLSLPHPMQTLQVGFGYGLGFGAALLGYGPWTVLGGIGVYRHWMLRQTLTNHDYLPYNLARFLDYAASLILLRKVGGGYIFVHRYLLEYFADLETDR